MNILLTDLLQEVLIDRPEDDSGVASNVDQEMTKRTLQDEFDLSNSGLEYVKSELAKLNKKAKRIGVEPIELKIVSEYDKIISVPRSAGEVEKVKAHFFKVKVEGKAPIIDGYEFVASIEHSEAGNIINMSPKSSVPRLPPEYQTTNNACDYCHTKRDRLNTFVLKQTDGGKLMKVGRSCLKNFLPGKNPSAILGYGEMLSNVLRSVLAGEEMEDYDDPSNLTGGGGGSNWSRYYPADVYLRTVCLAYAIEGRFISAKKAKESVMDYESGNKPLESTANFAWFLLEQVHRLKDEDDRREWEAKIAAKRASGDKLYEELEKWIDTKDWDAEIEKHQISNPGLSQYFHNLKVLAKSSTISRKNSSYHASILAIYLREVGEAEKKAKAAQKKPSQPVGSVGGKVEFIGTIKFTKEFDGQYGISTLVSMEDENGNEIVWWASGSQNFDKGQRFKVKATVKKHEISKYNGQPQTVITRAKMQEVDDNGKPIPAVDVNNQWGKPIVPHSEQDAWKGYTK